MGKIAVYMRVSTDKQSTAAQEMAIRRYLTSVGIDPNLCLWFIDKETGATMERPGLQHLDQMITDGIVTHVIFWRIDRLSRKMLDGLILLSRWLEWDVRVTSITQSFDFTGPIGRMIASLLLSLAEMERDAIRERVRIGVAKAKASGKKWGGATWKHRRIDGATKKHCIYLYTTQGLGHSEIARRTNVSRTHVYNMCKARPEYKQMHLAAKQRLKELRQPPDKQAARQDAKTLDLLADIIGVTRTPQSEPAHDRT